MGFLRIVDVDQQLFRRAEHAIDQPVKGNLRPRRFEGGSSEVADGLGVYPADSETKNKEGGGLAYYAVPDRQGAGVYLQVARRIREKALQLQKRMEPLPVAGKYRPAVQRDRETGG